jgi:Na+-translocating ferredoxin:NAD+ oxidoreductase RnfD subunit
VTHRHRLPVVAALRKYFRSPKGLLTVVLAVLLALSVPLEGISLVLPGLAAATAAAMMVDLLMLRRRARRWEFPSGALLTGLLVAMVLAPYEPWYVGAAASAIGVLAKYVARTRAANIFNPAALGIVVTFYVFDTGQNWWGALPELAPWTLVVLVGTGVFIASRVNKMPLVLVFLGAYYLLFSLTAFVGDPARVAEIFRPPDLQMALFFAFFILTDPPTSPVKYRDQVTCGAIVAIVAFAVFEGIGAAYYLLAGVLVGNLWEAWRRVRMRRRRTVPLRAAIAEPSAGVTS